MKKYKVLFFDFDGTIVNTYQGITSMLDLTFEHYGYQMTDNNYNQFIGPPLSQSFGRIFGADRAYEIVGYFRKVYEQNNAMYMSKLYDGIAECIKTLKQKGYTIAVATSKKQEDAEQLLEHFGLKKHIDFISGLCYNKRETKIEVLGHALEVLGQNPKDCIMIGDTHFDVEGAENFGMDSILCLWGFGDFDAITNSNVVARVQNPMDIVSFLDN